MSVSQPQASEQYERWKKYPKTYAEPTHEDWLRELSSARAEVERMRAALKQAHDAMEAFTDPEGNMPERTGEFNDLKKALHATCAALAATRNALPELIRLARIGQRVERDAKETKCST